MDINDLAKSVFGTQRIETNAKVEYGRTSTIYAKATSTSSSGNVNVFISDYTTKPNAESGSDVRLPTSPHVNAGDTVGVTLVGGSAAKHAYVSDVIGSGDALYEDLDETKQKQAELVADIEAAKLILDEEQKALDEEIARAKAAEQAITNATNADINDIKTTIAEYKATAEATYSTKTEVDEKTGAIIKTMEANYLTIDDAVATYTEKTTFEQTTTSINAQIETLAKIADAAIETYTGAGEPTLTNSPAVNWSTDELKEQHKGDLYYDTQTNYTYRWDGSKWNMIQDTDVTKALADISEIKQTYATKTELSATESSLSTSISEYYEKATEYTDSSIKDEVTNRNSAIEQKATSIETMVATTYQVKGDYATKVDLQSYVTTTDFRQTTNEITSVVASQYGSLLWPNPLFNSNLPLYGTETEWMIGPGHVREITEQTYMTPIATDPYLGYIEFDPEAIYNVKFEGYIPNAKNYDVDEVVDNESRSLYFRDGLEGSVYFAFFDNEYKQIDGKYLKVDRDDDASDSNLNTYKSESHQGLVVSRCKNAISVTAAFGLDNDYTEPYKNGSFSYSGFFNASYVKEEDRPSYIALVFEPCSSESSADVNGEFYLWNLTITLAAENYTTVPNTINLYSQITQNDTAIKSEVYEKDDAVITIYSSINQQADRITAEVSRLDAADNVNSAKIEMNSTSISQIFTGGVGKAVKDSTETLSTLIRSDASGVTVGLSTDGGSTFSYGRTHISASSFDILNSSGTTVSSFSANSVSLMGGKTYIKNGYYFDSKTGYDTSYSATYIYSPNQNSLFTSPTTSDRNSAYEYRKRSNGLQGPSAKSGHIISDIYTVTLSDGAGFHLHAEDRKNGDLFCLVEGSTTAPRVQMIASNASNFSRFYLEPASCFLTVGGIGTYYFGNGGNSNVARISDINSLSSSVSSTYATKSAVNKQLANKVTPLYRLYNSNDGFHITTASASERSNLINAGWTADGTLGYIFSSSPSSL